MRIKRLLLCYFAGREAQLYIKSVNALHIHVPQFLKLQIIHSNLKCTLSPLVAIMVLQTCYQCTKRVIE